MAVLLAVTAYMINNNALDKRTASVFVRSGQSGNVGSSCSYCISVISQCFEYMD